MASMSSTVDWERHVRSRISADTPGPHPLDVTPSNADLFTFGGAELVENELALVPSRFAEEAARVSQELGVRDAFRVRTELINLKKVMLTMHKDSTTIERGLRQAAAFFRTPSDSAHGSFVDRPQLHTQFSDALSRCRGLTMALKDGRALFKAICCVPRHPDDATASGDREEGETVVADHKQRDNSVNGMQQAQEDGGVGRFARKQIQVLQSLCCYKTLTTGKVAGVDVVHTKAKMGLGKIGEKEVEREEEAVYSSQKWEQVVHSVPPVWSFDAAFHKLSSLLLIHPKGALAGEKRGDTPHLDFVRCVLVARGAAKAMLVRAEAKRFLDTLAQELLPGLGRLHQWIIGSCPPPHAVKQALRHQAMQSQTHSGHQQLPPPSLSSLSSPPSVQLGIAIRAHNQGLLLEAYLEVMEDLCTWLAKILGLAADRGEARNDEAYAPPRLFVAGDDDRASATSMVLPQAFVAGRRLKEASEAASDGRVAMVKDLEERDGAWPPWLRRGGGDDGAGRCGGRTESKSESGTRELAAAEESSALTFEDVIAKETEGRSTFKAQHAELVCGVCRRHFSKLWVHLGVCCECDHRLRQIGVCPYGAAAKRQNQQRGYDLHQQHEADQATASDPSSDLASTLKKKSTARARARARKVSDVYSEGRKLPNTNGQAPSSSSSGSSRCVWCPHHRKCLVHDLGWSGCGVCRVYRGDGEDVALLCKSLRPAALFLDFDRTLASTRRGGSPLKGNHSVDEHLAALCRSALAHCTPPTRAGPVEDPWGAAAAAAAAAAEAAVARARRESSGSLSGVCVGEDARCPSSLHAPPPPPPPPPPCISCRGSHSDDGKHGMEEERALTHRLLTCDDDAKEGLPMMVHVVTRNSYREDIKIFLRRNALPVADDEGDEGDGSANQREREPRGIRVHTVVKHQSKADVVCDPKCRRGWRPAAGAPGEVDTRPVVFVDDTLAEHFDARFCTDGAEKGSACVHRVLFSRGRS